MALVFQYRLASHVPGSARTTGNAFSGAGSFSPTGRYVLFDSSASNLAGSDSNASSDLFLYDTQDSSVDLVSHAAGLMRTTANGQSSSLAFAPDGNHVLFTSRATNLIPGQADNNSNFDL